jgi:hypothetical protein
MGKPSFDKLLRSFLSVIKSVLPQPFHKIINVRFQSLLGNVVADHFMKVGDKPIDVDPSLMGCRQHQAIIEVNSGSAHQFAGDEIVLVQDADI